MTQISETLLLPFTKEEFRTNFHTQKAFLLNTFNERFSGIFNWRSFYLLLQTQKIPLNKINLSLNGNFSIPSDYDDAIVQLKDGKTVNIRSVEKYETSLSELCISLSQSFNARCSMNLYTSYPGNCGLGIHYDTHDIFIIQLHGKKKWMFFPPTVNSPLPEIREREYAGIVPRENTCYLNTVLERGNIFYLPRGHWHQALAVEPSMHIAVSVRYLTGTDFFKAVINQATLETKYNSVFDELKAYHYLLAPVESFIIGSLKSLEEYKTFISKNIKAIIEIIEDNTLFRAYLPLTFAEELNKQDKMLVLEKHLELLFNEFRRFLRNFI